MNGRLQVALLLAALFGGYAVIGMVDADEAVRDAAQAQMRACTRCARRGANARMHAEQRRAVCDCSETKGG